MADLTLIVGNKNYSSWSLRPYVALRYVGVPFDEVVVPLRHEDTAEKIGTFSPAGRVPILKHGDLTVWDSLAICEYLADTFPEARLWPADRAARAIARAVSAEMHSGFTAMRTDLPMNIRATRPPRPIEGDLAKDVTRVKAIWRHCRQRFGAGGPLLFGEFSVADAMFAPVVMRFRTYNIPVEGDEAAYMDAVLDLPALKDWAEAARQEKWAIAPYDAALTAS